MAITMDSPAGGTKTLAQRADVIFFIGCLLCGTWVLGVIGSPILLYGMYLMRQAQLRGEAIRPWTITVVGGLILIDSSVNFLAWGMDMLPANQTVVGRSLWIDYGMFADGAYAMFYNSTLIGGVALPAEKAQEIAMVCMAMPMKMMAAWGLLRMKRWGLQWSIIANWMYFFCWFVYVAVMCLQFESRFSYSEFGVLGFWLIGGIPYLGPLVLLPYLHTVNRELWSE